MKEQCPVCNEFVKEEDIYSDGYWGDSPCEDCFNARFSEAKREKNGSWFEANFNRSKYPDSFWASVGAMPAGASQQFLDKDELV